MTAKHYIRSLGLQPHPEGGHFRETYRSEGTLTAAGKIRNYSTAIYFLLEKNNFSAFHRIKSDELWHFYEGDPLEVIEIDAQGKLIVTELGKNNFQYCVKAGHWFGSRVKAGGEFALAGCTVSPGFDFEDFEMAKKEDLLKEFPGHRLTIESLCRG